MSPGCCTGHVSDSSVGFGSTPFYHSAASQAGAGAACILSAVTALRVRPAVRFSAGTGSPCLATAPPCPSVRANEQVQFKHQAQDSPNYSSCGVPIPVTGSKDPLNPILTGLDLWKTATHSVGRCSRFGNTQLRAMVAVERRSQSGLRLRSGARGSTEARATGVGGGAVIARTRERACHASVDSYPPAVPAADARKPVLASRTLARA